MASNPRNPYHPHDEQESPQARLTQYLADLLAASWDDGCEYGDEIADYVEDEETGEVRTSLVAVEDSIVFETVDGLLVTITLTVEEIPDEVDDEAEREVQASGDD